MAADYGRIHRLLKVLTLIQGEAGWTAKRLALECGTTERNIYRDLKMLEGAGVPYFFDKEAGGYAIRRDFFMPPVSLTLEESLALVALAQHVGGGEQVPFLKAAEKAIAKVRCAMPAAVQQELTKLDDRVAIKLAASMPPEGMADVYQTVRQALTTGKALFCEYDSLSRKSDNGSVEAKAARFLFKPYTLFFSQRAWYVLGRHDGRGEVRCLKLNRFSLCQPTPVEYEVPKAFSVARHLGNAWRMIRGSQSYDVEIWFDAEFAETISDTHWHATQQVIFNDDDTILFRCTVDGLDEIVWWVLSMGPHCVVKKPNELADRVKQLAAELVKKYAPQGKKSRAGAPASA
jgi:proteasome accessory factor B